MFEMYLRKLHHIEARTRKKGAPIKIPTSNGARPSRKSARPLSERGGEKEEGAGLEAGSLASGICP